MMARTLGSSFRTTAFFSVFAMVSLALAVGSNAQIPTDCCNSTAIATVGSNFACPQGDGDALSANGLTITVNARDCTNTPVTGIPATDIWLIGCDNLLVLCGGQAAINASGPTDASGQTTITGAIKAGGCSTAGLRVVIQGIVVGGGACNVPCLPIKVKTPDLDGNLKVDIVDFAMFGTDYPSPPKAYKECLDIAAPVGTVTLGDFAKFGIHMQHQCI